MTATRPCIQTRCVQSIPKISPCDNRNQDSKVHGPTWGHLGPVAPDRSHVGPMNFAIRVGFGFQIQNVGARWLEQSCAMQIFTPEVHYSFKTPDNYVSYQQPKKKYQERGYFELVALTHVHHLSHMCVCIHLNPRMIKMIFHRSCLWSKALSSFHLDEIENDGTTILFFFISLPHILWSDYVYAK